MSKDTITSGYITTVDSLERLVKKENKKEFVEILEQENNAQDMLDFLERELEGRPLPKISRVFSLLDTSESPDLEESVLYAEFDEEEIYEKTYTKTHQNLVDTLKGSPIFHAEWVG